MSRFSKPNGSSSFQGSRAREIGRLALDLASSDPLDVGKGVDAFAPLLPTLDEADYRLAIEALCSVFYIDTTDRPEMEGPLDRASDLLAGEGVRVVPLLLGQMEGSDIKSHMHLARSLGKIGAPAIPKLRDLLATAEDPYTRSFALYAIGKMTVPEVAQAIPEVLGGLMHPDKEVRDSAARTLGKIAVTVPSAELTTRMRREMFESLLRAVRDPQAPVRAKAMRSLGKMAGAQLLDAAQIDQLAHAARACVGESGEYEWDSAFIVRREAREALAACGRLGRG
jgi:HEAT repeat protein